MGSLLGRFVVFLRAFACFGLFLRVWGVFAWFLRVFVFGAFLAVFCTLSVRLGLLLVPSLASFCYLWGASEVRERAQRAKRAKR